MVYAPYAPVTVHNTSAYGYGLLWSRTLDFSRNHRPYTFSSDKAIQERFLSLEVQLVSWKELRD